MLRSIHACTYAYMNIVSIVRRRGHGFERDQGVFAGRDGEKYDYNVKT